MYLFPDGSRYAVFGNPPPHSTPSSSLCISFDAKTRNSTKFYYRDYAQSDVEHYAQNRHEAPLKVGWNVIPDTQLEMF